MNYSNCFTIEKFDFLKKHIVKHGMNINLHERLIADKKTITKEVLFQGKFIELVENSNSGKIIIIDKNNKIPTYVCQIKNNELIFAAYNARLDSSSDIDARRKDWCDIITKISMSE